MYFSGLERSPDEIIVIGFGAASHHRSAAAHRLGAISLTLKDLVAAGQAIIGSAAPSVRRPPTAKKYRFALATSGICIVSHDPAE